MPGVVVVCAVLACTNTGLPIAYPVSGHVSPYGDLGLHWPVLDNARQNRTATPARYAEGSVNTNTSATNRSVDEIDEQSDDLKEDSRPRGSEITQNV